MSTGGGTQAQRDKEFWKKRAKIAKAELVARQNKAILASDTPAGAARRRRLGLPEHEPEPEHVVPKHVPVPEHEVVPEPVPVPEHEAVPEPVPVPEAAASSLLK